MQLWDVRCHVHLVIGGVGWILIKPFQFAYQPLFYFNYLYLHLNFFYELIDYLFTFQSCIVNRIIESFFLRMMTLCRRYVLYIWPHVSKNICSHYYYICFKWCQINKYYCQYDQFCFKFSSQKYTISIQPDFTKRNKTL